VLNFLKSCLVCQLKIAFVCIGRKWLMNTTPLQPRLSTHISENVLCVDSTHKTFKSKEHVLINNSFIYFFHTYILIFWFIIFKKFHIKLYWFSILFLINFYILSFKKSESLLTLFFHLTLVDYLDCFWFTLVNYLDCFLFDVSTFIYLYFKCRKWNYSNNLSLI